jgi:hypothetical protein
MTVPAIEVNARRTLAASVHADFTTEAARFKTGGRVPDWLAWSHRLDQALSGLLDALAADGPPACPSCGAESAHRTCRHCGRCIAQSPATGLWWALDGRPVGETGACLHEPVPAGVGL